MRVVVDTNVVLSGIFFGGTPGRVLEAWVAGRFELMLSSDILGEYERAGAALGRRYPERTEALAPILSVIVVHATLVVAPPLPNQVSDDSDDDIFLAAALHGRAAVVVSGDRALLRVSGWEGIRVLSPRQFVDEL